MMLSIALNVVERSLVHCYLANMQNMDWNLVRDFLAVARTGSLNRAAQKLGVNASTVGRRIETLEGTLGVHLFQRSQTGYVLTDEGEGLIARAEAFEEASIAFERRAEASGNVEGRVLLATTENLANFLIIPALPDFRAQHPKLRLEILTDIRAVNLNRREADLALRMVRPTQGNVSIRRLGTMHNGLYGSVDYVERRQAESKEKDTGRFDEDEFISWPEHYGDLPAAQWINRVLQGRAPALVTSSLYAQLAAARAGLGLAVLPCFMGDAEPVLRNVPSDADVIVQEFWLAIHTDLVNSARVRVVANFLTELVHQNSARL
ncbi:LysR family transcriptional regulator [Ahrensia kielensis]|uniref:LysR family transcriptional regulator n=1 Tax=Ahrensia kielensis TaxID=76980 RepID=A0ABU9T990_9HYPH